MIGKALLGAVAAGPVAGVVLVGSVLGATGGVAPDGTLAAGGRADEIPPVMLGLYRTAAATCPGLAWEVLAGIGRVETDHGRDLAVSSAGAKGPMQFLPGTWAEYGVDADGTDAPDVADPADAVFSAARMLCADGAGNAAGVPGAVFAYNHSVQYVTDVLGWAAAYSSEYGPD